MQDDALQLAPEPPRMGAVLRWGIALPFCSGRPFWPSCHVETALPLAERTVEPWGGDALVRAGGAQAEPGSLHVGGRVGVQLPK